MNAPRKTSPKTLALLVLVLIAGWFVFTRLRSLRTVGQANTRVWFYDQSERQLYPVPGDTIPPHKGIGGESGDGVRAVVVTLGGKADNPRARRIAYLETYGPERKAFLDRVETARVAGRHDVGPRPPRHSEFVRTNTLVKRVEDAAWVPSGSAEGRRIKSEWRSWRGPEEQGPVVCVP